MDAVRKGTKEMRRELRRLNSLIAKTEARHQELFDENLALEKEFRSYLKDKGGASVRLERRLLALGCPKLNLQVRSGNTQVLDFYRALGYLQDDVVSLGKRLIADTPAGDPPPTSTS